MDNSGAVPGKFKKGRQLSSPFPYLPVSAQIKADTDSIVPYYLFHAPEVVDTKF